MTESEDQLEKKLISQLKRQNFEEVDVKNISEIEKNLKTQLEKLNSVVFSDQEFSQILNYLSKGGVFEKSKNLRDKFSLKRKEKTIYIDFFDFSDLEKNIFQVTNQIEMSGKYENRYDVTIFINGLPLVQIELKKRGIEMKEAFNQINRYYKHSFVGTIFEFVQVFIISNGVDVKYFSNNHKQSYEQTFFWTDKENKKISELEDFAEIFLDKNFLGKYISEYIVLAEAKKIPMVLRPYQYYAVKAIEDKVKNSNENGYIWHTTGSGKTLTSFKTAQILKDFPDIEKVLFIVDRKDLDIQTVAEFQSLDGNSVDGSNDTNSLVKNLEKTDNNIIVSTIQKLDRALSRDDYKKRFQYLADKKVVIIFDEAHRGQFGDTHKRIKEFFTQAQMFGFTGTPIFADNANNGKTTKDIFGEALHKYIITDAIADQNVLGFHTEYVGKYTSKDLENPDLKISDIDKKEIYEDDDRIEKIAKYILKDWKRKTQNGKFNAMFATASVDLLKKYYLALEEFKDDNFKIATIFSYQANEEDKNDGSLDVDEEGKIENQHSREFLDFAIEKYNKDFGTNFSTKNFEGYREDLQKRIKDKDNNLRAKGGRVDLVIVVNMMLTGFDAQKMNTLYVDKNLKYHGLIQAYSRTNRLFNSTKPKGNIVNFRNLKKAQDKALELYGNPDANEVVFVKEYKEQVNEFNEKVRELKEVVSEYVAVDELKSEEEKAKFVKIFRDLMRKKVSLESFAEFSWDDLNFVSAQEYENYKGKYFEIYENLKKEKLNGGKESILENLDFELELVLSEDINYDYVISLISSIVKEKKEVKKEAKISEFLKNLKNNLNLRKKEDLIKKFIEETLPSLPENADVKFEFEKFWESERERYLEKVVEENNFDKEKFDWVLSEYKETGRLVLSDELLELLPKDKRPVLSERKSVVSKIKSSIFGFVNKFQWTE